MPWAGPGSTRYPASRTREDGKNRGEAGAKLRAIPDRRFPDGRRPSVPLRPDGGKHVRVTKIRIAVGQLAAQLLIDDVDLPPLGVAVGTIVIVTILQMDRVRQPGLSARIWVAGMNSPSVMEAHLPLPQGHGDNANLPAVRTELLFHLTQILLVEKPNVLQARPAMASGHHDERTASDVHRVEWNPHRDHLVRTAGRPVCSVRVPAGHGA